MKKIFTLLSIGFISFNLSAQKAKLQSAVNYLKYDELDRAKEAIDLASENADTKILGKTWHYKGKIYAAIANSKNDAFKSLSQDPLSVANDSYLKAFELGGKKLNMTELNNDFAQLINPFFNQGIEFFKNKSYEKAASMFEKTAMINNELGIMDTLSIYNTGLSYANANKHEKALESYKKILNTGYAGDNLYTTVAQTMLNKGDKAGAIKFIQEEGLKKYPNSQNLINYQFSLYLEDNDFDGALKSIDASIANEPNNAVYHYNRGFILDQKGESEALAVASYDKAIELDPKYFDAYYNVGAMFFNTGANKIKERNELPLNAAAEAKKLEQDSESYFEKALPYLEKAHELNPTDKGTMLSLKEIYARQNKTDKLKAIQDKLTN